MKHIFNLNSLIIMTAILFIALQQNRLLAAESSIRKETLYKNKPVLVTGGCGFIGSHLVEELVSLGANVTVLDNLSTGNKNNIAAVIDQVHVIEGSITDLACCIAATEGKEIIFHLAAFVSVPASTENPDICHTINVTGTQNMLEAARINNVKRFVFSSSCSVYGESTVPCTETMTPAPTSPYGFSKLMGEIYCKEYAHVFDMETVSMRYFNVYGLRQDPHSHYAGVIAKFMYNMERNLPITVFGDGTQTRDYVPVKKIVEANIMLGISEKKYIQGEVFNVATEKSITLLQLVEHLKKNYPDYNQKTLFMPARPGDVKHVAAHCSKYNNLHALYMQ